MIINNLACCQHYVVIKDTRVSLVVIQSSMIIIKIWSDHIRDQYDNDNESGSSVITWVIINNKTFYQYFVNAQSSMIKIKNLNDNMSYGACDDWMITNNIEFQYHPIIREQDQDQYTFCICKKRLSFSWNSTSWYLCNLIREAAIFFFSGLPPPPPLTSPLKL